MKNKLVPLLLIVVIVLGAVVAYKFQATRTSRTGLQEALEAQRQRERVSAPAEKVGEQPAQADEKEKAATPAEPAAGAGMTGTQTQKGPEMGVFKVRFACSNGDVVVECHPEWAPIGVARFRELVEDGFFSEVRFFRVVTQPRPFVAQFGISGDPAANLKWRAASIKDDPVTQSNVKGTLTFATSGKNSRTTQLFINLGNNTNLDGMGFAPIGKVVEGMDVVLAFNDQYQEQITKLQGEIMARGNAFLDERFPGLDYIKSATIVE